MYWLFAITGTTFSLMAGIGFLILMGVVVNNGIVSVDAAPGGGCIFTFTLNVLQEAGVS